MDGRAHRRQPSVGDRTPYQIELGEDLPPGSRGLFELSTSPAYPLPVKAPVNLLATTIHTTPLRRHVRLQIDLQSLVAYTIEIFYTRKVTKSILCNCVWPFFEAKRSNVLPVKRS
jgi:hypothetical protein